MEKFKDKLRYFFKNLLNISMKNRYIILEADIILGIFAFIFAIIIHNELLKVEYNLTSILTLGGIYTFISVAFFILLKSNRGLVRHSGFLEFWRLYVSLFLAIACLYIFMLVSGFEMLHRYFFCQNLFLINLFFLYSVPIDHFN